MDDFGGYPPWLRKPPYVGCLNMFFSSIHYGLAGPLSKKWLWLKDMYGLHRLTNKNGNFSATKWWFSHWFTDGMRYGGYGMYGFRPRCDVNFGDKLDKNASGICHGRNLSVLISMRNSLQISPIPPGFGSKPFGDNTSLKLFEAMQQHGIHNFTTFTHGQPRPLSTTLVVFSSMWKHVTVKPWLNHGGCRALYRYLEPMNYGLFGPRPQGDENLRWFTRSWCPRYKLFFHPL